MVLAGRLFGGAGRPPKPPNNKIKLILKQILWISQKIIVVNRSPWAPGTSVYILSIILVFSDPQNPRETKLNSFWIKFLNIPGDDPGNQVTLGTRYIGVQFKYDICFQRPRKPPNNKIKLILKQNFMNISGDDPGNEVALGTRYVGTNFECYIHVQGPQKPPSKKFWLFLFVIFLIIIFFPIA